MHLLTAMVSKATQSFYKDTASPLFSMKLQVYSELLPTSVICQRDFVLQKAESEMGGNPVIFYVVFIFHFT